MQLKVTVLILLLFALPFAASPTLAQTDTFAIAYGDTVSNGVPAAGAGNIETGGAADAYTFSGTAGDTAIFDALTGSNTTFRWSLVAPSSTVVFTPQLYMDRQTTLAETGIYTLIVTGANATVTGTYSFRLLAAPPAQNFAIAIGDTVTNGVPASGAGNLEVPGAVDRYTFSGTAGQGLVVEHMTGSNSAIGWALIAPDGTTTLFNAILSDRLVTLPQTGTYTLTVDGNNIDSTGTYSFKLWDVPTPQNFAVAIGDTVSNGVPAGGAGNIETPGAVDNYTFSGTAGQLLIFDHISGSNVNIGWTLTAPDGTTTVFNSFIGDRQVTLTQTGTYMLLVDGNSPASTGTYSFSITEGGTTQSFTINFGDTVSNGVPAAGAGNIEAAGAVDIYTFSGTAGQNAIFDVLAGNLASIDWILQAPSGTALFGTFLTDQQELLPETGTYTLTVSGVNVTSFGTYSFLLTQAGITETFAINFGDTVSNGVPGLGAGNIEVAGAVDVYTFSGSTGQNAIFDVLAGEITNVDWRLEAPSGAILFSTFFVDQQLILPQTGTYSLTVDGFGVTGFGTYSFLLTQAGGTQTFAINFGDTVSNGVPSAGAGNLEAAGSEDRYTFSGIAGQDAIFRTITSSGGNFDWRLEAPDGTPLFSTFFVKQYVTLPQTGTYTLIVNGVNIDDFGTYSFTLLDSYDLAFMAGPPSLVFSGEDFIIVVGTVVPGTNDVVPVDGLLITLLLVEAATGAVIPGETWSGTTANGLVGIDVMTITPGVYFLRTDVSGISAVDSATFEVTDVSTLGGGFLPPDGE